MTNLIIQTGRIIKDAVLKEVNGTKVTNVTYAVNYETGPKDNRQEHSEYIDVAFWGAYAEAAEKHLKKGVLTQFIGEYIQLVRTEKEGKVYTSLKLINPQSFLVVTPVIKSQQ